MTLLEIGLYAKTRYPYVAPWTIKAAIAESYDERYGYRPDIIREILG